MTPAALANADWMALEARVAARLGFRADDAVRARLADVVADRLKFLRLPSVDDYVALIDSARGAQELDRLAQSLTIGESYFLRGSDHFAALAESVLPERLDIAAREGRPLRILSAGCSSGEEIYSVAIVLADRFPQLRDADFELRGIDVTEAALEKARRGIYTPWSLRDVPADVVERHFRKENGRFELSPRIRERVRFERANLSSPASAFPRGRFDVIFCRNVLIYFTPEAMRDVIERFAGALAPGGYLFLGHSESLRGLSRDFRLCQRDGSFHYQRLDRPDTGSSLLDDEARRVFGWSVEPASGATAPPSPEDWVGAIGRSQLRVESLSRSPQKEVREAQDAPQRPPSARAASASLEPAAMSPDSLAMARAAFARERYAEVVRLLAGATVPAARLLEAAALAQLGRTAEARAVCEAQRTTTPLDADAACLLAICHEQDRNPAAALESARLAAYLDSGFAAPHLVLARLAGRTNDRAAMRRSLVRALQLLDRESELRVQVFGGGFSAPALAGMVREQLAKLEVKA